MKLFHFESKLWLPRPCRDIFEFFSDARNLETLTPPWLQFHVVTPEPVQMREGAQIDYRLKIRGIPARWRSLISVWDPPNRFVDEQVHGPYRVWIHEHRFTKEASGTSCEDRVQYAPPGGYLINKLLVERDIRNIFAYRTKRLREIYGAASRTSPAA